MQSWVQSFRLRKMIRRHGNVGNLRRSGSRFSLYRSNACGEPKPFFRKQTGTWYVQVGKKQHNLGPDEQVAKQKYHALMAGRQPVAEDTAAYGALLQFLGWNTRPRDRGPSNRR